jgi:putative NIF3 family GTP cyclohydrolase 1 type 2
LNTQEFKAYINELFDPLLQEFNEDDEYGFYNFNLNNYMRVGFATNITPEVILQAAEKNVEMIVTHHDAWHFIFGMKEKCMDLLVQHNIAHFFVHLPLDYVDFGTCNSLLRLLGVNQITQISCDSNGTSLIGIGEYDVPITFEHLVKKLTGLLGEKVILLRNNNKEIKRIGVLTGAGNGTNHVRMALNSNCDAYITGEKTLYTLQYGKFVNMNIIVGSHTFTEIFGVESLAIKLKERYSDIEIIQLQEEHIELPE